MTAQEAARRVQIPFSLTGDSLEAKVRVLGHLARHPHRGIVLLHPLSTLGGSMNDAVVSELWRAAQASKAFGAVLAYNQRGVGASSGSSLGSAVSRIFQKATSNDEEKDATDVFRAIEYLVGVVEEAVGTSRPVEICLVGYSYGSALAAQAVHHKNVISYVGISPPLGRMASFFLPSQQHFRQLLKIKVNDERRRLVVMGTQDQYTNDQALIDFILLNALKDGEVALSVEQQQEADGEALVRRRLTLKEGVQERLLVELYARNDHFWGNDAAAMVERCIAFAAK